MPHRVQPALQLLLQVHAPSTDLLWPWISVSPLVMLRNWHFIDPLLLRMLLPRLDIQARQRLRIAHTVSKPPYLVQNHEAHLRNLLDDLKRKVERLRARWLIAGIVPYAQVSVLECRFHADALRRVKGQHTVKQVERVGICGAEQRRESNLGHVRQIADIVLSSRAAYAGEGDGVRSTEIIEDLVELVDIVAAFEKGLATKELGENAADRPDIDL